MKSVQQLVFEMMNIFEDLQEAEQNFELYPTEVHRIQMVAANEKYLKVSSKLATIIDFEDPLFQSIFEMGIELQKLVRNYVDTQA